MQVSPFFHNLALLLFSEIVIFMFNWQEDFVSSNSVGNHTPDKQIGLPQILLSIVWLQLDRIGLHLVPLPLLIERGTIVAQVISTMQIETTILLLLKLLKLLIGFTAISTP